MRAGHFRKPCAGIEFAILSHMAHQELIQDYLNELAYSVSELCQMATGDIVKVSLGDASSTLVELRLWPGAQRVTGRIVSRAGDSEFELRVRPRHVEYRYSKAGPHGSLRARFEPPQPSKEPRDEASRIVTLARRLQHFSIFECVRRGIRRDSQRPSAA